MDAPIYLDANATTPMTGAVRDAVTRTMAWCWGNPSGAYALGRQAKEALEASRAAVARAIGARPGEIVFTSGGSESDNFAIKGTAAAAGKGTIITSAVEHPAVGRTCTALEGSGYRIVRVGVDSVGRVDPDEIVHHIDETTILITIMAANNEVGTIQPVDEIARVARTHGIVFHTDAVQAIGKVPFDVEELQVDTASISAHKLHGPKGIGALYIREGAPIERFIDGGNQEMGFRAGTENTPAIVGMARAIEWSTAQLRRTSEVGALRDRLEAILLHRIPWSRVNGDQQDRLSNTSNMTLPGVLSKDLVARADRLGVAISAASACKVGDGSPSHVLLAMGLSEEDAHCSARFTLSYLTTPEEIEAAGERLVRAAGAARGQAA